MEKVLAIRIPYPKIESGKYKNQLYSMNQLDRIHWSTKSKIRNTLKTQLREWYFERNEGKPYQRLTLTFKVLRKSRRKFDAINVAPVAKVVEDILTDLGYVEDDTENKILLEPSELVPGLVETMLDIIVEGERDD